MKKLLIAVLYIVTIQYNSVAQNRKLQIHSDFAGGNVVVEKIDNDTVWLKPDLRDTKDYWFYWYFKVTGISGKTVHFQFPQHYPAFARYGPAYSTNNDSTWKWYGESSYSKQGFTFSFLKSDTCAYFSMGFPYTQKNLYSFLKELRNKSLLKLDTLCFSREGRAIEEIHIIPSQKTIYKVLITARHHSCEMMANYELEGIIRSILNEKDLQFLRDHVEFSIIPFVDKDGVEDGDQGKNRRPRDYNRDYDDNPIYPVTRAIKAQVHKWSENKLKIALDLHCPYLRGNNDAEYICLVGGKSKIREKQQIVMSNLIEKNCNGELKFYSKDFLAYGTLWNVASNTSEGPSFGMWGSTIPGIALSTTIEFPYANVSGIAISKDNARVFGRTVAYSIQDYLKSLNTGITGR